MGTNYRTSIKVNDKDVLDVINVSRGKRSIAPRVLKLDSRWMCLVKLTPRPSYRPETDQLNTRLGGHQKHFEKENFFPLLRIERESFGFPNCGLVSIQCE